ncbi:glycosyltransferase family 4 protein [uncultured Algibacter sp.]|uniref:glycosyltransferase family 4 protein n=1 Tax=uncultured Algibacter sp. TaxID=298659 RepID=UPI003217B880
MKKKIIRVTTVPISLSKLLEGQLGFINQYYEITAISSKSDELLKVAANESVLIHDVEMTRKITPLKDIIAVFKLYRFLIKEKPHIVHSHTPKAGIVSMIASWLARTPNRLHTVAGLPLLEAKGFKRIVLNFVERLTYKCATKVYPNSNKLNEIIITNKLAKENKLKVIGNGSSNGINTKHFSRENFSSDKIKSIKEDLKILNSDFVYVFVGRLVKDKGINELIESFLEVHKINNYTKLLLVGPFEDELDPIKLSNKDLINNNNNIISTGYVADVRPYLVASDVLVFPSYREGFPNVVMQAASLSLPCIVSNINGCNEIITNGYNGIIVPPKDKIKLEEAMITLLNNDKLYSTLKNNARKSIVDRFEQVYVWEQILAEYKKLD